MNVIGMSDMQMCAIDPAFCFKWKNLLTNKGVGSRMPIIGPVHWQ